MRELMHSVDPDIILNICNRMAVDDQDFSIDEIEKN
jgi:hypothetical protein